MSARTVDALEREAQQAQQRADAARVQAQAQRDAQAARQAQRREQVERQALAEFDEAQLEADMKAAREELRQAVLADPVYRAWIRWQVASQRRYRRTAEARALAEKYDRPRIPDVSHYPDNALVSIVHDLMAEADALAWDEEQARLQTRQDEVERA